MVHSNEYSGIEYFVESTEECCHRKERFMLRNRVIDSFVENTEVYYHRKKKWFLCDIIMTITFSLWHHLATLPCQGKKEKALRHMQQHCYVARINSSLVEDATTLPISSTSFFACVVAHNGREPRVIVHSFSVDRHSVLAYSSAIIRLWFSSAVCRHRYPAAIIRLRLTITSSALVTSDVGWLSLVSSSFIMFMMAGRRWMMGTNVDQNGRTMLYYLLCVFYFCLKNEMKAVKIMAKPRRRGAGVFWRAWHQLKNTQYT